MILYKDLFNLILNCFLGRQPYMSITEQRVL